MEKHLNFQIGHLFQSLKKKSNPQKHSLATRPHKNSERARKKRPSRKPETDPPLIFNSRAPATRRCRRLLPVVASGRMSFFFSRCISGLA